VFTHGQFGEVACTKPHTAEIVANFVFPSGAYPGQQQVNDQARRLCVAQAQPYLAALPNAAGWQVSWAVAQNPTMWAVNRYLSCGIQTRRPTTVHVLGEGQI